MPVLSAPVRSITNTNNQRAVGEGVNTIVPTLFPGGLDVCSLDKDSQSRIVLEHHIGEQSGLPFGDN